jgi:hypothetical protein
MDEILYRHSPLEQEMDMTSGFEQNQTDTDGQWNEIAQVGNSSKC